MDEIRMERFVDLAALGEAAGCFDTFSQWVNHAQSWIGGTGALCVDARGRVCLDGGDMQRARDEGAFPVSWYLPPPDVSTAQRGGVTEALVMGVMIDAGLSLVVLRVGREDVQWIAATYRLVDVIPAAILSGFVDLEPALSHAVVICRPKNPSSRWRVERERFGLAAVAQRIALLTVDPTVAMEKLGAPDPRTLAQILSQRVHGWPAAPRKSNAAQRVAAACALWLGTSAQASRIFPAGAWEKRSG